MFLPIQDWIKNRPVQIFTNKKELKRNLEMLRDLWLLCKHNEGEWVMSYDVLTQQVCDSLVYEYKCEGVNGLNHAFVYLSLDVTMMTHDEYRLFLDYIQSRLSSFTYVNEECFFSTPDDAIHTIISNSDVNYLE